MIVWTTTFTLFIVLIITSFLWFVSQKSRKSRLSNMTKHVFDTDRYTIYEIESLLDEKECKMLIDASSNKLKPSNVMSNRPLKNVRTSTNTFLKQNDYSENSDIRNLLGKIDAITVRLSNKNIENQEPLQIVKYEPNQYYVDHYDCCVPMDNDICKEDTRKHGLRYATLLIYLNDVEEGGETSFPLLNCKFKPKTGKGIYFFNLTPNQKRYHELSKHAGLPPIAGTKWVCNKWIRTKRYI